MPPVQLSVNEIITKSAYTLTETIDYILMKRDILEKSVLSQEDQVTFDEVADILKSTIVDSNYDTTIPDNISAAVIGCMDPNAENFNPDAQEDDGSCIFTQPPVNDVDIVDIVIKTVTYYIWSEFGKLKYTNVNGEEIFLQGNEYDFFEISFSGEPELVGDIRTYPKERIIGIEPRCNDVNATNFGQLGECKYTKIEIFEDDIRVIEQDDFLIYPGGSITDNSYFISIDNDNTFTTNPNYFAPEDDRHIVIQEYL